MGSQNTKTESNQHNSFMQGQGDNEGINLDDTSRESSIASSLIEITETYQESNLVNVTFHWDHGGNEVYLMGSFNSWSERVRMERVDKNFSVEKSVERGMVHEYKFIVDGEWRFAHDQPTKKDQNGNINNWVDTTGFPESVKPAHQPKLVDTYTQELCSDFTTMEPDPLPSHLHYVLANHSASFDYRQKQTIPPNSPIKQTNAELAGEHNLPPNELPIPPHVILNHVGIRANDRYIGLTTSQRYKEKFVTSIYYKPIH